MAVFGDVRDHANGAHKQIPQEAARQTNADSTLPQGWPLKGEIAFEKAKLRYRPELPPAIKCLDVSTELVEHLLALFYIFPCRVPTYQGWVARI